MALKPAHYSMLGLGITAVVGLVGILYYMRQSAASAGAAAAAQAQQPFFQTAAIPQYSLGSGTNTTSTAGTATTGTTSGVSTTGATGTDTSTSSGSSYTGAAMTNIAALVAQLTAASTAATAGTAQYTDFNAAAEPLLSQFVAQAPGNLVNLQVSGAGGQYLNITGNTQSTADFGAASALAAQNAQIANLGNYISTNISADPGLDYHPQLDIQDIVGQLNNIGRPSYQPGGAVPNPSAPAYNAVSTPAATPSNPQPAAAPPSFDYQTQDPGLAAGGSGG